MLSSIALLLVLQMPSAEAAKPKFLQDIGNMLSGVGAEVKSKCTAAVAASDTWIAENGEISAGNIHAYTELSAPGSTGNLDNALNWCLEVKTKSGSDLQKTQREMATRLLELVVAKHLVIDASGDGRSYTREIQGFYNDEPFPETHIACNEMDAAKTKKAYTETWLLTILGRASESAASHPEVQSAIQARIDELVAKGRQKSDACLTSKLGSIRPYGNAAASSIRKKWEATARSHFAKFTDKKIVRVVFPEANWRRTKRQDYDEYNKTFTPIDFYAMDIVVYIDSGEFVDGYIGAVVRDQIQGSEYITFAYEENSGALRPNPDQRVLKSNF